MPPGFIKLGIFTKIKKGLKDYYAAPQNKRRQQKPPYIPLPLSVLEKIRLYLIKEFNSKCAYCESKITTTNQGDFDHFRPKSSARGLKDEFSLDHYWTLAFDWRNMYLCCEMCGRYKVNWFPVEGSRASLSQTYLRISRTEKNLLIDPCNDKPKEHLAYDVNGKAISLTQKGEVTIGILKLNRKELVEARKEKCDELFAAFKVLLKNENKDKPLTVSEKGAVNTLVEWVNDLYKSKTPNDYAGIQRYFIEKRLTENPELVSRLLTQDRTGSVKKMLAKAGVSFTIKKIALKELQKAINPNIHIFNRFSISVIEIENFKSIEKLTINFPSSQNRKEPWLMLLGENGVGKSSFLQAVTLTLMGETYRKKLPVKPSEILRNGTDSGFVKIHQADQPPIELHFTKSSITTNIKSAPSYLLAYGSTRLFPSKNIKPELTKGKIRAKNMFSPDTALFADNWLLSLNGKNKKQFDFAARALKAMLSKEIEDENIRFIVKDREVFITYSDKNKKPDKLRSLSDGYKSIIALACDMMQALMQGNSTMEVAEGIVLLDEIGTHLHPRWKMRVVNSFRLAFPKLQFIVTTHDPLCLKGLYAGEIAVFDKDEKGKVYAVSGLPDPGEFRAEQLLSSRFFGLNSTIDDELEKEFNEYYSLLGMRDNNLTSKEKTRLEELKSLLKDKKHLGDSLREELAFYAIDKLLAREKMNSSQTPIEDLKEETISILQELWDKPTDEQQKALQS